MSTHAPSSSAAQADRQAPARPGSASLAGIAAFVYGLIAYAAFLAVFLYAIGFVGNWLVWKSIDSGPAGGLLPSLLINALLLTVFVVQHTIMARPAFKTWWTRFVPRSIERSTFVLLASAALALVFWQWQPLPEIIWDAQQPVLKWGLSAISLAGWAIVLYSSFLINHFDLFGLRQVWLRLRERAYAPVGFRLISLYRYVRHPLMLGFLIAFWATPTMTVGHLFFAGLTTGYICFGTWMEERDLVAQHGDKYTDYRRRVPRFFPTGRRAG